MINTILTKLKATQKWKCQNYRKKVEMNAQTHTNPFAVVNQNKCYVTVLNIHLNILFKIQIVANSSPCL